MSDDAHNDGGGPAPRSTYPGGHGMPDDQKTFVDESIEELVAEATGTPAPPPPPSQDEPAPAETGAETAAESSDEQALDSGDFERVTLLDLPKIATYGPYELLGRIAFGGMAEIYLARELGSQGTQRMMVVKRVLPHVAEDDTFVEMFRDEARLAMQLNHPNICHVYSFGEAENTYYLAMEWVNGKPLSKLIRRAREHGGMPIPIALKIIAQVAEALDYAHRAADPTGEPLGVVHRDVSPQNVMISYDGVVKLLDFGIAKATSHSSRTEAGVIKGKFAYMSPQQCVGEPIDSRADIFALGICLFEALAGKNPFRRKTEFETMTHIVGDPTPDVLARRSEIPEAVAGIIEKALMKQPDRRYQTAADMQFALEQVLASTGTLVNSARIGEYIRSLFAEDVRDGPQLDTKLSAYSPGQSSQEEIVTGDSKRPPPPGSTELDAVAMPVPVPVGEPVTARRRGTSPVIWGLAVLTLLGGLAAGGGVIAWTLLRPSRAEPVAVAQPTEPAAATPPETPPAPPAAPSMGSVFLESDPPGASIELDGSPVAGQTPLDIGMVSEGVHVVTFSLDGHEPWRGNVVVVAGRRATLTGDLVRERRAARPPGRLSLNTRPWSKVYVGRRLLGTTPIGRAEVPSGTVRLRLVDRDGTVHRRTVRVPSGGHVSESFDLR